MGAMMPHFGARADGATIYRIARDVLLAGRSERELIRRRRGVVVGTAGHIDHGKSALVQALTGTDPDRLQEEKARGITIDLGFAHWTSGEVCTSPSWTFPATSASSRTCSPESAASTWCSWSSRPTSR